MNNVIDIFYYIAIIFIINTITLFFRKKEIIESVNKSIDALNKSDACFDGSADVDAVKQDLKKIKFNILGFSIFAWEFIGITMSNQKILFILLFVIRFVFIYVIRKIPNEKIMTVSNLNRIVRIFILLAILYNHFLR